MDKHYVSLGPNIDYAVVDEGDGPAVLLLHGFPDSSALWRHQVPALLDAGYRVIAPDLRGFGESSKPDGVENYRLLRIIGDLSTLLRNLGVPRAHVVAHDWGAAVAWLMASVAARKVDHLVAISVGHPTLYHNPSIEQREKSWYMLLYQFEGIAEELVRRNNWALLRAGVAGGDIDRYIADLGRPGALTAGLNWYRANRSPAMELDRPPNLPFVSAPTLAVWGEGDRAMLEEGVVESESFVTGPWRYARVAGAGHWVPLTRPNELNELLLGFLDAYTYEPAVARSRRPF